PRRTPSSSVLGPTEGGSCTGRDGSTPPWRTNRRGRAIGGLRGSGASPERALLLRDHPHLEGTFRCVAVGREDMVAQLVAAGLQPRQCHVDIARARTEREGQRARVPLLGNQLHARTVRVHGSRQAPPDTGLALPPDA